MKNNSLLLFYVLIVSTLLIQCQCGDTPTEPPGDTTRPTVLTVSPANNATAISINDSIVIVFSEKINSSSVTTSTVSVASTASTVNLNDSTVVLKFSSALQYNTSYTLTISTSVTDIAGNALLNTFSSSFTTEIDPLSLPPSIVSRYPMPNATINNITDSITVTFSKNIDPTTINDTTFYSYNNIINGTVSYEVATKTAIYYPSVPLAYDSNFTMVISNNVKDSLGNSLTGQYGWLFYTQSDPNSPQVGLISPQDSIIIGDTITFLANANSPAGYPIDTVQFFIDNNYIGTEIYTTSAEYVVDASLMEIGSEHTIYAIAYDSSGNSGVSNIRTFFYLWQEVYAEGDDGNSQAQVPNDLRKLFSRTTDSTLELRYEYGYDWTSAYSDTSCLRIYDCGSGPDTNYCSDTAVDLGIYLDTDNNINTGRRDAAGDTLNDIGAEYRIILGLHGGAEAFADWNSGTTTWDIIYDTNGFFNHNISQNTNIMEIGLKWTDLGNPSSVNIVNANVFFRNFCDPGDFVPDFMPDRGSGHISIKKENRYVGPLPVSSSKWHKESHSTSIKPPNNYDNPFD